MTTLKAGISQQYASSDTVSSGMQPGDAVNIQADVASPVLTVSQSISGNTTSATNTLFGTVSDAGSGVAAVEILMESNGQVTDLGQATLNGNTWSYTATSLSPGTYSFYAVGYDRAGNATVDTPTGPNEMVIASTVPSITALAVSAATLPAHDTIPPILTVSQSISGNTTSTTNILSGTISDAGSGVAAVEILDVSNGQATDLGQATLNGNSWSYTAANLGPGTHTFYAAGYDRAGNATTDTQTGPSETVTSPSVAETKSTTTAAKITATMPIAISAATFTASIGVNTHLDCYWTAYANTSTVISDLEYLSVTKVRDSMAASGDAALFKTVAAATGVRFDVYLSISSVSYDLQIAAMKADASILASVEGINEGDGALANMVYRGQTGYAAIAAAQTALYAAIKANPATSSLAVIAPSYGDLAHFGLATNTAAVSDDGNAHEYFGTGNAPADSIETFLTNAALVADMQPVIATEGGYYTGASLSGSIAAYQHSGVSELVQAKYDLTLLFDDWKAGIKTTYLYELLDDSSDNANLNNEDHYGLFNASGAPKLAATALHNLLMILTDNGTARSDGFGYQIAGASSATSSLLLEKSSGVFDLVIWNDIRLADSSTGADITNPATPVTLSFGQHVQSVTEYDPLTGVAAVMALSNVDHVSMSLPDHPVILEITPNAPAQLSLQSFVLPQTVTSAQTTNNLAAALIANAADTNLNLLATVRIAAIGVSATRGQVAFDATSQSVVYTAPTYSPLSPTDSFTYTLADAQGHTVTGTVAITEAPPANTLYDTVAGNRINAPANGWTLVSLAAGEQLYSDYTGITFVGSSDTKMYGGTANNTFTGGNGNHYVGAGINAHITLGDGDNTLALSGSGNTVVTGNGNNLLWRSTGNTSITMGNGNQNITMSGQNNNISIGVGISTITVGFDGNPAGNERVTVGGGTNTINAGGENDTILIKGGTGNQVVAVGSSATITIQSGSNMVSTQGTNSVVTTLAGSNSIATSGDGDTINLGIGHDTLWAGGNNNRITAGSGTSTITFIGQGDTIDLSHGTETLTARGSSATLVLAAPGLTPAQIFGDVMAAGDIFDLRIALAGTTWDGRQSTLGSYLSVSNNGAASTILIDADGARSGPAAAIAVLNSVAGLTFTSLLAHSTLPA